MGGDVYLQIDREKCAAEAMKIFTEESGVGGKTKKHTRMQADALMMRELVEERIDLKAAYRYYDNFLLEETVLHIGTHSFECAAFEQLKADWIEGVYVYAITAGNYQMEELSVLLQVYADIWGTAFTDALRVLLVNELKKDGDIGDSFGPGYYGMSVSEMPKLAELLDFNALGIEVRENGILLPIKSCAGILFRVNEKYQKLNDACRLCYGNIRTCKLCSVYPKLCE